MYLVELSIVEKGIIGFKMLFSMSGLAGSLKLLRFPTGRFASTGLISALFCSS